MADRDTDILIIGGGLAGATLRIALQASGLRTLLAESNPSPDHPDTALDTRSLALSPASVTILDMLGVWQHAEPAAMPISRIHVSERGRFGRTVLESPPATPLGHVIEMHCLQQALQKRLDGEQMLIPARLTALDLPHHLATLDTPEGPVRVRARLIVAADGADSTARKLANIGATARNYHQSAIVTNIRLARPHQGYAFERFTAHGPIAMLPLMDDRAALVWTLPPQEAAALQTLDDACFLARLQNAFGYRLGKFLEAGSRTVFPLREVRAMRQTQWPLVLVANAAHTLHPAAGQGFNLGLRDVAMLAQSIITEGLTANMLAQYVRARKRDQQVICGFTDGLVRLFTLPLPGLGILRAAALTLFDHCDPLKQILTRHAQGFGGTPPDLACRIPARNGEFA